MSRQNQGVKTEEQVHRPEENVFADVLRFEKKNNKQEEKTKFDQQDYRKLNYAFEASMGWGKKLNDNFTIFIQPSFKFWFKGMLVENNLNRSLYSLGVRTGIRFE